jgi:hypothetical protein
MHVQSTRAFVVVFLSILAKLEEKLKKAKATPLIADTE